MGRGRRYEEPRLNIKKVFAVIIAIAVIIMSIIIIKNIINTDKKEEKITSKDYFVVFKDNKYGVIDSKAGTIITPSYAEMIIIPNSKKDIFLCTYDVNYETGEYKTKALNSSNQEIFTEYEQIEAIQNKDANDNLWYEDNILKVKKDGKYGLITFDGKEILPCIEDEIEAVYGIENAYKVTLNGKYGVVDNQGKEIVKTEYTEITNLGKDNKSGFIVKNEEGKYGIVDYSGQIILEIKYEGIEKIFANDIYVVKENNKQKIVKKD
ncbi:MAG: WG repeat-containing protein [Clostridia bacterium]|nr:WG repeat-containing protein [Clostridia bacterium]